MDKFEIRELKTNDIFKISEICEKIGVNINVEEGVTKEQLGVELLLKAFKGLHKARNEVNDFFGSLIGMSGKEFGELNLKDTFEIIKKFKEVSGVTDFLKSAGQSIE